MLDPYIRPLIDPPLNYIGKKLASFGISANMVTFTGLLCGIIAIIMISVGKYNLAVIFVCLNRLFDGFDGAVARNTHLSDFGGFLDILCDFIIYSGIVFAFGIANQNHLFYSSFLVFSFIGPITTFLAYANIAAKKKVKTARCGKKSFYYLGGICEGTETAVILILICVFPNIFNKVCIIYGTLCWLTTLERVYMAWDNFGEKQAGIEGVLKNIYTESTEPLKS